MTAQKKRMIIDTSSIVFAFSNRVNIFEAVKEQKPAYAPMVSAGIVRELEGISRKKGRYSGYAGAALAVIKGDGVEASSEDSPVDDWILGEATAKGYAVCTNDIELKKRLKSNRVTVFSISRQGMLR